jgi:hypothetical protein
MVYYHVMNNKSEGFSLHDVVLLVGMQSRTGELVVESGNNIGTILFYKSAILHASSPYSRSIGDLLVEAGIITETDLLETLMSQKKMHSAPLGNLLIKSGKVSYEIVEMMVHEQIRQAMNEFQLWQNITFSFVDKDIKPFDNIHLPMHMFIQPETLRAAAIFLTDQIQLLGLLPLQTDSSPSCDITESPR